MKKELKEAILSFILATDKDFQLINNTIEKFRPYIYTTDGEYLIGGKDVSEFIDKAIRLIKD